MKCPKCGYHRQTRDNAFVPATECPACGVVYSKHENGTSTEKIPGAAPTPPNLRPSPVDSDSLKKARDRVEKRLRKRLENNVQDERHAQTLKLARRFTKEEIRKRRDQWEENQQQDTPAATSNQVEEDAQPAAPDATEAAPPKEPRTTEPTTDRTDVVDVDPAPVAAMAPSSDPAAPTAEEITTTAAPETETPGETMEPESDVSVETVILASAPPEPSADESAPSVDATPSDTIPSAGDRFQMDATSPEKEQTPVAPAAIDADVLSLSALNGLNNRGNGLVSMLSAVAWLILGAGVIGAVLSWTTISDVEAGMRIPVPDSLSTLPLGLLLGFAYLATGALGFAFFWVSSIISRQLKDIRRLLMLQPGIMAAAEQADDFSDGMEDADIAEASTNEPA